jgi:hypothetical protein
MISAVRPLASRKRLRDSDVRGAVLRKVLNEHVRDQSTLVVEELGIEHGNYRVDIAVVNGFLHGYELKSQSDNLLRLPAQIAAYSRTFDRVTLIVDESHFDESLELVPNWWGVKIAEQGIRGAVNISTARSVKNNPSVCLLTMAHLLWRDEAIALLEREGVEKKALRSNRASLYRLLVDAMEPSHLRYAIRESLKCRENWRDPASPS